MTLLMVKSQDPLEQGLRHCSIAQVADHAYDAAALEDYLVLKLLSPTPVLF